MNVANKAFSNLPSIKRRTECVMIQFTVTQSILQSRLLTISWSWAVNTSTLDRRRDISDSPFPPGPTSLFYSPGVARTYIESLWLRFSGSRGAWFREMRPHSIRTMCPALWQPVRAALCVKGQRWQIVKEHQERGGSRALLCMLNSGDGSSSPLPSGMLPAHHKWPGTGWSVITQTTTPCARPFVVTLRLVC
jgi:hypothetical protein